MQQKERKGITMKLKLNNNDFTTHVHTLEVTAGGVAYGNVTGIHSTMYEDKDTRSIKTVCKLNPSAYLGKTITNRYELIATVGEMLEAVGLDPDNYIVNRVDFSIDVVCSGGYEKYLKFFRAFIILVKYSKRCKNIMYSIDPTTFESLTIKTTCNRGTFEIEYYNKAREAYNKNRHTDIDGRLELRAKKLDIHCKDFKSLSGVFDNLLDTLNNAVASVDIMNDRLVESMCNLYAVKVKENTCDNIGDFCRFMESFIYSRKMLQELYMFSREHSNCKLLTEKEMQKKAMKFSNNFCDRVEGFQTFSKRDFVGLVTMISDFIYAYDCPTQTPHR